MKLMRIGELGEEIPCVLDGAGLARDVSAIVVDFDFSRLSRLTEILREVDLSTLPVVAIEGLGEFTHAFRVVFG